MDRPDLINAISSAIIASASSIGISPPVAQDLAHQVEDRLRLEVGGSDLRYINKVNRRARADRVKRAFTGANIDEIARSEKISTRQVRRILFGK